MVYILGLLVSLQIIAGQVLWKIGIEKSNFIFSFKSDKLLDLITMLLSPFIIAGVLFYVSATVMFVALLSKFEYTSLQAVVVSTSLMFTFIAANLIFDESYSVLNLLGFLFLFTGVLLVTKF